ncbi:hypothetical protein ABB37_09362 [Leptomonas pyrrhocoris]|uniref:Paraquat-inducible protein A n=1 Tax=Leptomonas pyrrhocoris TaxID=157538 RepID=A0A0N0VCX8_LEPPY|nr:hypothetical protein ABB37_09362 [Leptomonas pyrrhocoris]KPA74058.1 hypothetical protein ABB37_09362 [Leptomonas pyrrhocoris]|eukprot:XP_015652497.1 hypothetical protein ABB37_09362 [Leptomonas pyrrhocoris]
MQLLCLSFALLFSSLNLTSVPLPGFNESFLGAHAFNLTCTDIVFGSSGADWATNRSLTTSTTGGSLHCYSNFTVYNYAGLVHADIAVNPSDFTLTREPLGPDSTNYGLCFDRMYAVSSCTVDASVTRLYSDPPSRLVDLLLQRMRSYINENLQSYVCNVLVPQMQQSLTNTSTDLEPQRNSTSTKRVFPLRDSHLVRAAANIFSSVFHADVAPTGPTPRVVREERVHLDFYVPPQQLHIVRSLVAAPPNETAVDWLQEIVDDVLSGTAPQPFSVFDLPGEVTNASLDYYVPEKDNYFYYYNGTIVVDATMESCDANSCEVYLDPGVAVRQVLFFTHDSVGLLMSHSLIPRLAPIVNTKIDAVLRAMAVSQQRNLSDPNATVHVSFGKTAVLRRFPKLWPLALIFLCAVSGGTWMVRRNTQLHATQPVRCSATGEPVAAARLVLEDINMIFFATACLLLFAASNTMTGASVLLGKEMNTYSFSMWNTVTDLWRAGLIPLSVFVLVFSGVYPYVKLLSLVYFTVWAQRPLSKRLALIDVMGKFSFIDTFALMVMVSGMEIQNVAHVIIHPGFYFFMFATVASIALGNYATTLYRRGTSHRVPEEVGDDAGYEQVATHDSTSRAPPPPVEAAAEAPQASTTAQDATAPSASSSAPPPPRPSSCPFAPVVSAWRWCTRRVSVVPFVVVHLCSLPAWKFGCLQYTIGGLARILTPPQKTLSLWQLSLLNKWGRLTPADAMVPFIFMVSFFTILLAPCIFALMPKRGAFLASWCAADVFVVACVAGLLQLHQFITFVLGDGMDDVYTAHATLRWPMLPLTVAALVVWYVAARDIIGVAWLSKRRE